MNNTDREELRCLIEKAVKPTYQAATHAAEAAGLAHEVAKEIRLEINGGPGYKGLKERVGNIETRCTINHDPDNTQKREAITEQQRIDAMKRALRHDSDGASLVPKSRRRRLLDSQTARTVAIVIGTALGSGIASWAYFRETGQIVQAAPVAAPTQPLSPVVSDRHRQ